MGQQLWCMSPPRQRLRNCVALRWISHSKNLKASGVMPGPVKPLHGMKQVASRSIRVVPYQFTEVAHGSEVGHVPLPSIPALTMMDFFDDHSPRELLDAHEASEAGVSANSCPFGRVPEPKQSPEVCSVPELFRTSEAGESTNLGGPVMTARSESIADVSVCPKASEAGESSVSPSHVSPAPCRRVSQQQ